MAENSLKGRIYSGEFTSKIYPNAKFAYTLYAPPCVIDEKVGLYFSHDGLNLYETQVLEDLANRGECPYCLSIGVHPGKLSATVEGGTERDLRMNTYDVYSEQYPNFVVDELIPYLLQTYNLRIAQSPDMHMVTGGSSGGISAWNIAWHRTDYFRRVYMSSPSFLAMARGNELIDLMRKFETKPIRVYADFSENEPDDYFGSSYCVADASIRALRFAGYDMMSNYYPGEGHCSRYWGSNESIEERFRFLWKDWKDTPIQVKRNSPRVEKIVLPESKWEKAESVSEAEQKAVSCGSFTAKGEYTAKDNCVCFTDDAGTEKTVAEGYTDIRALAISSDKWRLYIADAARGYVYACTIRSDGSLDMPYVHGFLHHKSDFRCIGATAMCVDAEDRLYVATELGIQLIRSYGLIDVILEKPDATSISALQIGKDGYLYAKTAQGCYRRRLENKQPADPCVSTAPKNLSYYD